MKFLAALATVLALVLPTQAQAIDTFNYGGNEPCSFCSELMGIFDGNDPANMFPSPEAMFPLHPIPGYTPPSGFDFFSSSFNFFDPFGFMSYCSDCGMAFDFMSYCSYCEMVCPLCGDVTTPVPEAENYALMLAGLAFVGYAAQRRRRLS